MLRRRRGPTRSLAAVVFNDVAGSTELAARIGDEAWKKLLERHLRQARASLRQFGGREIDTAGDGLYATFQSPFQAVAFALDVEQRAETLGIQLRSGIHMGEVEEIGGKSGGIAVHIGARIASLAAPGEVLVSSTVRDLAAGGACSFEDRGNHDLKGVPGTWTVFRAEAVDRAAEELPAEAKPSLRARAAAGLGTRRGRVAALLGTAAVVAVLVATGAWFLQPRYLPGVDANSVGHIAAGGAGILGTLKAGSLPEAIAAGEGSLWVTDAGSGSVARVDLVDGHVIDTIDVGNTPSSVAVGHGAVWVANAGDRTVSRISPATGKEVASVPVGNGPTDIATDERWVWVTNRLDGTLARIDPAANVATTYSVGTTPTGVATGAGSVWVSDFDAGAVVRVDPGSGATLGRVNVGNGPASMAAAVDQVWVVNSRDGTVMRIDPATNRIVATVEVGAQPEAVAIGDAVWVAVASTAEILRIDPATNQIAQRIRTQSRPRDVATNGSDAWFTVRGAPTSASSHRGGTLRVIGVQRDIPTVLDPNEDLAAWDLLTLTHDGLVGFKQVGGADGTTIVANLAERVPTPTDGGLTWTFTLQPGITYSDGTPLRASDVRRTVERHLNVYHADFDSFLFGSIDGVAACAAAVARCDLSASIEADDAARTVTFHLVAPDAEFLQKLAQPPAFILPAAVADEVRTAPVPGTGPYVAQPIEPDGTVRAVRYLAFHEWSTEAQPDGYPDEIVWQVAPDEGAALQAVETGAADVLASRIPLDRIEEVRTRHPGQLYAVPPTRTFFEFMNTTLAPFDDPDVRRAVNLATDRAKLVELWGGRVIARPTCQATPPGFPGYEPYCPYTVGDGRTWLAPDLSAAKAIIERAGARGAKVTVRALDFPNHIAVGEYFVGLLNELGMVATLAPPIPLEEANLMPDYAEAGFQMMGTFSFSAYPAPSAQILGIFTCPDSVALPGSGGNWAAYCNHDIDARIVAAMQRQTTDLSAAYHDWAEIDKAIVDESPAVAALNPIDLVFVSERAGNVQVHPASWVLLSQIWVQ